MPDQGELADEAPAIRAQGLVRTFGDKRAVDGVDLEVAKGEIYGFLGPNGAGKSTVVRMLCTLLNPTGGSATVAGFDVATQAEKVRLRIGVALQEAALDERQTGRELLRLQCRLYGLHPDEVDRRVADLSGLVDIGDALDRVHRDLQRRHEAQARSGGRTRAQPRGALPGRAHHGSRSRQPGHGVGRGARAQHRARHDHLPHDPVPRRSRRARAPCRHHRPRPHRRRGHAGQRSSDRSAAT